MSVNFKSSDNSFDSSTIPNNSQNSITSETEDFSPKSNTLFTTEPEKTTILGSSNIRTKPIVKKNKKLIRSNLPPIFSKHKENSIIEEKKVDLCNINLLGADINTIHYVLCCSDLTPVIEKEPLEKIDETNTVIKLDKNELSLLTNEYEKETCEEIKKRCVKIVKQNVNNIVNQSKEYVNKIREKINEIREHIKKKNLFKIETLVHIKEKIKMNEQQYEDFKNNVYSKLKNKGDKKIDISFKDMLEKHPDVIPYINQLKILDSSIIDLETDLKNTIVLFKNSVERIKELMRENNTEIESRIFKLLIKDTQIVNKDMLKHIIEKIKNIKTQKIRKGNNNHKTIKRIYLYSRMK